MEAFGLIARGKLRGEKIAYPNGEGACVWYPFDGESDDAGLCFDFPASDLDDFIALLKQLRYEPAEVYEEKPEEPYIAKPFDFVRHWVHSLGWWLIEK